MNFSKRFPLHKLATQNFHPKSHHRHFSSLILPTPITPEELVFSLKISKRHFIEHLSPNFTPLLISSTLRILRSSPELALKFIDSVHHDSLPVECHCLAISIASQIPSQKQALELIKKLISSRLLKPQQIFDGLVKAREELEITSSISLDLLIRAFCKLGDGDEAVECFQMMKKEGILPNTEMINHMLSLFLRLNWRKMTWVLFGEMFRLGISINVFTCNILTNVLCNEGDLEKAMKFVRYMEFLGVKPNVVTYNTIINGYCVKGDLQGVDKVLGKMREKKIEPDLYTYGSLITSMCKNGKVDEARALFKKMDEFGLVQNVVIYHNLIDGYCKKGEMKRAFRIKGEMVKKEIYPTVSTYNSLIQALFMNGRDTEACSLKQEMETKGVFPDAITYKILIDGYCANGEIESAISLLKEMEIVNVTPDDVCYNTIIRGYCRAGKIKEACGVLGVMKKKGIELDYIAYKTLISAYINKDEVGDALRVKDEMESLSFNPTRLSYNTLIQDLCKFGGYHAEELLKEMVGKGVTPDDSTYASLIEGFVDAGEEINVPDEVYG